MMKYVLAVMLAMVSAFAMANEYIGVSVGSTSNSGPSVSPGTSQNSNFGIATYGANFDQLSVEGRIAIMQAGEQVNQPNTVSNFVETRARYNFADVLGIKPWIRAALGEKIRANGDFAYVSVEPGVGYQVTADIRSDVSIARIVATSHVAGANQTVGDVSLSYAIAPATNVGISYARAIGSVNTATVGPTTKSAVSVNFNHSL